MIAKETNRSICGAPGVVVRKMDGMQILLVVLSVLAVLQLLPASTLNSQTMSDIGLETSFQDTSLGHHKRGRASIAADFDLDGYIDFWIGNPGDESLILRNIPGPGSLRVFEMVQILTIGDLSWGGVAFDYDNDGDYDLFITCGGNEGIGFDYMFRNDWIRDGVVTGELAFTDVTEEAGVAGPVPDAAHAPAFVFEMTPTTDDCSGHAPLQMPEITREWTPGSFDGTDPVATASAGAVAADYDQDGDVDLFVNGNIHRDSNPEYPQLIGRNSLFRNNGDGTFSDVTYAAGLGSYLAPTRHSTFLDYDNDSDQDLIESNFNGDNLLWRNNRDGTFTDVTTESSAPGHDLHFPSKTFASAVADLNNDGWEDIICFMRGEGDAVNGSPYEDGHALFMNWEGVFENIAASTVINDAYVPWNGVMGCMVADANGDGFPDIYVGNGGPEKGVGDQFYTSLPGGETFVDQTGLVDFPAAIPSGFPAPDYPYRTHAVCFIDVDRDGVVEISVVNGGTASGHPGVREPNRLFRIELETPSSYLAVRPVGNGNSVSLDAIGTRIELRVSNDAGSWSVHRTLHGGNAFSAQNGFELHFSLADATAIEEMRITWPDGSRSTITEGLALNSSIVVSYDDLVTSVTAASGIPSSFELEQNYPNPFNPSTTIRYRLTAPARVSLRVFDLLGREVATLAEGWKPAGEHAVTWVTNGESSGIYFYSIAAGEFFESRKLVLSK